MKILFLMKPLAYVKPDKDTSLLLMQASQRLGHDIYFLPQGGASVTPEGLVFDGILIACTGNKEFPFDVRQRERLHENDVDVTFRRDHDSGRPRINKSLSRKDREQRAKGDYYSFDS